MTSPYSSVTSPPVVATYANAYGKFGVADNFCGFSYAATDAAGKVVPLAAASLAQIFGPFNGVGLSAGIDMRGNATPSDL